MFFFMLFVLGIGSSVSVYGAIITIFTDQFPNLKYWKVAVVTSILGFLLGLIYVTPGGQYMLNLVDYFAVSFNIFVLASIEVVGIIWIYGLDNLCEDVEFMLHVKVGMYWRLCWGIFTPLSMIVILVYSLAIASPLTYGSYVYPDSAYACGWVLMTFGIIQIPFWAIYIFYKRQHVSVWKMCTFLLKPSDLWGPSDPGVKKEWQQFKREKSEERKNQSLTFFQQILYAFLPNKRSAV